MKIFDPHVHMTSRTTDDYEAMARGRHRGDRRTGLLAGSAADEGRQLHRLLQQPARLGAVPRVAVRHPPFLHDRSESEGSEQPEAGGRGAGDAAALPRRRTASSRSARSGSTIRPTKKRPASCGRSSWRASSTCRCSSTRRTATRNGARSGRSTSFDRVGFPEERVAHRSQQRGDAADRARDALLGGPHALSEHEDGRAVGWRCSCRSTAAIGSSSTAPPTGASAIR